MERKKTLSLVSTIMMTIYAVLVTSFNLWMFAMAAVLGQLVGKNSTERLMIDGRNVLESQSQTEVQVSSLQD